MIQSIVFVIIFTLSGFTQAENKSSIEFFSSNNTNMIDVVKAYKRLTGKAQVELKNTIVTILQKNHIEQGILENILGIYQMSADNSEIFYTSPKQIFSDKQIFALAKQLANALNQESVAVFIPSKDTSVSDVTITFNQQPGIEEIIKLIHERLPTAYSLAFSLHLTTTQCGLNRTKVSSIEWLGSKINIAEIRNVFPKESITYQLGRSYLIYKNGTVKLL